MVLKSVQGVAVEVAAKKEATHHLLIRQMTVKTHSTSSWKAPSECEAWRRLLQ